MTAFAHVGGDVGALVGAFLGVAEDLLVGGLWVLDDLGVGIGGCRRGFKAGG